MHMEFNKRQMCRTPHCGVRDAEMVRQWIIQSCCIDPNKIHQVDNDFFVDGKPWQMAINYHMGVFGASNEEMIRFSKITESVPEVLLLHHADMIATKIYHV